MIYLAAIWAALYLWTVGALCAYFQGRGLYSSDPVDLAEKQRSVFAADMAAAVAFSLLPPVLLISPFFTDFYLYGWRILPPRAPRG